MTNATTTNEDLGIADELGIQYGDFVTVRRGNRVVQGIVIGISDEGDLIDVGTGMVFLDGADVSID
jgi:hypothetical protein